MLPSVHIPSHPSCQDCLAWSQDGELAVAAGEEVYLLIPRHGSPEPWTHLRITVGNFTLQEWPWQELASFKDMSIGEEQARATVTALAWSPPGLAKYRRSVLAVLTSNLILSLWASGANPTDLDSWERVLVVNSDLPSGSRHQQRIRSMAWAPTNPRHIDLQTPFSWRKWGIPLIAIADDINGVYILKVSSPFAGLSSEWSVEVLRHHNVPVSKLPNNRPSLLSLAMYAHHFVDRIEFGTWSGNDIPVMYRTSGTIHLARISVCEDLPSRVRLETLSDHGHLIVNLDESHAGDAKVLSQTPVVSRLIKARMAAEKEKFGLDNRIGSHVLLRSWGLVSFNNLLAACITLHPAKMVEYILPFDGIATILFDDGDENGSLKSLFPWQTPAQVAKAQQAILETIFDIFLHRSSTFNPLDLRILYTAFCASLLLSDDKQLQRLQRAADILNRIEHYTTIDLQIEHRALQSIEVFPPVSHQELLKVIKRMTEARGQIESISPTPEMALLELCPFCPDFESFIPFDNFTEAYCPQGHLFARCALTFVPLLEPGSSKRCIKCQREFIDEGYYPGVEMESCQRLGPTSMGDSNEGSIDNAQESTRLAQHSLAAVLFDKFDVCPYCDGKFFD